MNNKNAVVVIPTYNAKKSIIKLISKILQYNKNVQSVIVVDDNSPDKTAQLIKKHFPLSKSVKLIVRDKKSGRGSAVIRGFKEGLKDKKIKFFIEMDADLCHDPKYISDLINKCHDSDIAVASRYMKKSKNVNWKTKRRLFSRLVSFYLKIVLQIPIQDYTNGFRCYKRRVLESIDINKIQAKGFIVLTELAYHAYKKGFTFSEIPIRFKLYNVNQSNLNINELKEAFITVFRLKQNEKYKII